MKTKVLLALQGTVVLYPIIIKQKTNTISFYIQQNRRLYAMTKLTDYLKMGEFTY